jgi:phosphate transport system permease protein
MASMPVQIYNYATSPYPEWQGQAWTGALVLITVVLIFNFTARWFGHAQEE